MPGVKRTREQKAILDGFAEVGDLVCDYLFDGIHRLDRRGLRWLSFGGVLEKVEGSWRPGERPICRVVLPID